MEKRGNFVPLFNQLITTSKPLGQPVTDVETRLTLESWRSIVATGFCPAAGVDLFCSERGEACATGHRRPSSVEFSFFANRATVAGRIVPFLPQSLSGLATVGVSAGSDFLSVPEN
jgi:hypothetical protein